MCIAYHLTIYCASKYSTKANKIESTNENESQNDYSENDIHYNIRCSQSIIVNMFSTSI